MYNQMAEMMYWYIIKAETMFIRMYKLDTFEFDKGMSLLDLNTYITNMRKEAENENKGNGQKHVMQCLKSVSDYLNMMFYMK